MRQHKKCSDLSIAVFGRGGGVEHLDGVRFQRLDFGLSAQLASLFSNVILVPLVYRYKSPLWENFAGIYQEKLKDDNIKVLPVYNYASFNGKNRLAIRVRAWIKWSKPLFRALRGSDLALVYFPSTLGLIGSSIGFLMRKPIIAYIGADWDVVNPRTGKIAKPKGFQKLLLRAKSAIGNFLMRRFSSVLIRDYGIFKTWSKIRPGVFYVPGNTSASKYDLFRKNDTCQNENIVCLVVAALVPRKGVDKVIRAVSMLRQNGYPLILWHVGPSLPENLQKTISLCRQLGVEKHVFFKGYKNDRNELLSLYRNADIFVLASYSEGYPRVVTEAQSQSLPVVVTKVGGIPARLENGKDALLVTPGNSEEIASAIAKVIEDNELRKRIIANGFAQAQRELSGISAIDVIVKAVDGTFQER